MSKRNVVVALLAGLFLFTAIPGHAEPAKVSLTIYNAPSSNYSYDQGSIHGFGYAVVRETRALNLEKGKNTIRFTDVAKTIDATSVSFESLTDPKGTSVLEQNFEYDLMSSDKLLERYIDRPLTLLAKDGAISGKLLSFDASSLVIATEDKSNPIRIIKRGDNLNAITFSELPGGLITRPTLVWELSAAKGGEHQVKVAYQANDIGWSSDYTVTVNDKDTRARVASWVTIVNQSGASYQNAGLKLVAGDVQRVQRRTGYANKRMLMAASSQEDSAEPQFAEKSFFEYHLYTLQRTTSLPDKSMKQIELFTPAPEVPIRKLMVYVGASRYGWDGGPYLDRDLGTESNPKVDVYLEIANKKENGLGIPLPKGKMRVYKEDPDDKSLEFIGEDMIDHTAKDETLLIRLGQAFDVVGERKQVDYRTDKKNVWETFEITLKNHKDQAVTVLVKENLYRWTNWAIEKSSDKHQKKDSRTVLFEVSVPANGQKTVTYTVHYWGW